MFCKKCGTQLKENAKFCGVCGTPVQQDEQTQQVNPVQQAQPVNPYAQPVQAQPANPYAQSVQSQSVDPFAQPSQAQPADPFAQPSQAQPADPFAQPVQSQPADPFAQPVQSQQAAPFAQPSQAQPVNPYAQPAQNQQWGPMMQPQKNKKGSKAPLIIGLCVGALAIVVILVVVLLIACSGGGASSAQEAVEAYFDALNDEDFDGIEDIMYPAVFNEFYDEDIYEKDEFVELVIADASPTDEKATFSNAKITEKDNTSSTLIKTYNSALKEADGYIEIEKGIEAEGTVSITVDGEKHDYSFSATIVMAGGDWYIADISVSSYPED